MHGIKKLFGSLIGKNNFPLDELRSCPHRIIYIFAYRCIHWIQNNKLKQSYVLSVWNFDIVSAAEPYLNCCNISKHQSLVF